MIDVSATIPVTHSILIQPYICRFCIKDIPDEFKTIGPSRKITHIAEVKFLIPGEHFELPITAEPLA
jgi:hypothetical protein